MREKSPAPPLSIVTAPAFVITTHPTTVITGLDPVIHAAAVAACRTASGMDGGTGSRHDGVSE